MIKMCLALFSFQKVIDKFVYRVKDHGIFDKLLRDFMGSTYGNKPSRPRVRKNQPLAIHQIQPILAILAIGFGSKHFLILLALLCPVNSVYFSYFFLLMIKPNY